MIVCSCNTFSDHQVRAAVVNATEQPRMSKIYRCLGFKAHCGRCTYTIKQIMDETPNRSLRNGGSNQH
jgi:bacterioferritin-associated ferredoxin